MEHQRTRTDRDEKHIPPRTNGHEEEERREEGKKCSCTDDAAVVSAEHEGVAEDVPQEAERDDAAEDLCDKRERVL